MDNIKKSLEKFPKSWPRFAWTIGIIIFTIFLCYYTIDLKSVNPKGMSIAKNAITGIFTPDFKIITDLSSVGLLYLLLETIAIAFLGTFIGVIFALPFAFLASRNIAPLWVNEIFLVIISIIRAFPAFMYGIMFVKAVGLGPFAGVLSMALGSLGMLSKLLIESIEDIDPGVIEALDSMGCSIFEKIRY
ncbi:MAG: phosphonate ABC transporter, permease protein PhnE, partial [Erysipelotrichaceae bacterium]|nr:phosphonate ABC transporter, permease protein PhnE [Erysipelotrichaceae bacterium]